MLDAKKIEDIKSIAKYGKARGYLLAKRYGLPTFSNFYVIESINEAKELLKNFEKQNDFCMRSDTLMGKNPIGIGGRNGNRETILEYIKEIEESAKKLYEKLSNLKDVVDIKVEDTLSQIGGGSLPTEKIKSKCISIVPKNISTTSLEEQLRLNENPVVARISDNKLIIDMRCILEDEIEILAEKIINILK